jgi:hypothetical protein
VSSYFSKYLRVNNEPALFVSECLKEHGFVSKSEVDVKRNVQAEFKAWIIYLSRKGLRISRCIGASLFCGIRSQLNCLTGCSIIQCGDSQTSSGICRYGSRSLFEACSDIRRTRPSSSTPVISKGILVEAIIHVVYVLTAFIP